MYSGSLYEGGFSMRSSFGWKPCAIAIAVALCVLAMPAVAHAAQSGPYVYDVHDGSVIITGYTGNGGSVTVPTTLAGRSVTAISASAFAGNDTVTNVTIPVGVTRLGQGAFAGCDALTSVYFMGNLPAVDEDDDQDEDNDDQHEDDDDQDEDDDDQGEDDDDQGEDSDNQDEDDDDQGEDDGWFGGSNSSIRLYYHISKAASWKAYTQSPKQAFCLATVQPRNGGAAYKVKAPISSQRIQSPASPTRNGYALAAWYKDGALSSRWNFTTAAITGDIKVYAGWKKMSAVLPSGAKAASAGYESIQFSWSKVNGATKYIVYRASSKYGTYKKVKETTATSYTNTGRTTGKTYYYKVRAVSGSTTSKASAVVSAKAVPAKPSDVAAEGVDSGNITIHWGKVSGATKYQIYRATSKTGTYKRVATTSGLQYTNEGLDNTKTYYYKVRAYRLQDGEKIYGKYSAIVSAKP